MLRKAIVCALVLGAGQVVYAQQGQVVSFYFNGNVGPDNNVNEGVVATVPAGDFVLTDILLPNVSSDFLFPEEFNGNVDNVAGIDCFVNADCDDVVGCTDDTCVRFLCINTPNDANCADDGLFCNGVEFCDPPNGDPLTGCASTGPPCPDCTEELGSCDCEPPLVEAVGCKYLKVTPLPNELPRPMAIVLTCAGGTARYVGAFPQQPSATPFDLTNDGVIDGTVARLVDNPGSALFLTPAEWLNDVYVTGELVIPSTDYTVQVDCGQPGSPNLTGPVAATTWAFGDVFNDPPVALSDAFAAVLAFQGTYVVGMGPTTKPQMDFDFCLPNQIINLADVFRIVQAFQGITYAESYGASNCALSCP